MLKIDDAVKEPKTRAVGALRDLLGNVPSVEVESAGHERKVGHDYGVDGLVGFACHGGTYALIVEVRSNGAPLRSFRSPSARKPRGAIAPVR